MIVIWVCGKPANERYQGGSGKCKGGRDSLPNDDDDDDGDDDDDDDDDCIHILICLLIPLLIQHVIRNLTFQSQK